MEIHTYPTSQWIVIFGCQSQSIEPIPSLHATVGVRNRLSQYRATCFPGKVLNEKARSVFNQKALQASENSYSSDEKEKDFGEEEDEFLIATGEYDKGILIVVKRGKGTNIANLPRYLHALLINETRLT